MIKKSHYLLLNVLNIQEKYEEKNPSTNLSLRDAHFTISFRTYD